MAVTKSSANNGATSQSKRPPSPLLGTSGRKFYLSQVHNGDARLGLGFDFERISPGLFELQLADGAVLEILKAAGIPMLEEAFQKIGVGAEFEVYLENESIPQISGGAEELEDRYGVSIFTFKLNKVIPGKPAPEKPLGDAAPKTTK